MQIYNIRAEFIPVNFDIPAKLIDKTIQENGVYNASDDEADGYSSVTVVVPDRPLQVQELNVTPSTESQTIDVVSGIDGYGPVNVSAVENVLPENIKQGETILGVEGSVVELNGETVNISPTTSQQIIEPTSPHNGLTSVTVGAVTSDIDSNIQSSNIKSGVTILGTPGSVIESNETTLSVTPTTSAQSLTPTSPYTGFNEVNVSAVTSSIDANIQPQNIRENVTILGTTGTAYVPERFIEFTGQGTLYRSARPIDFTGITILGKYSLYGAYCYCSFSGAEIDMSGIKTVKEYACQQLFREAINLTKADFSGVTNVDNASFSYAFSSTNHNAGATTGTALHIDFSSLVTIEGTGPFEGFCYRCGDTNKPLTVDFSSVTYNNASGSAFREAFVESGLTSLAFPNMVSAVKEKYDSYNFYEVCYKCTSLTSVDFRSLLKLMGNSTFQYAFYNCTNLASADFRAVTQIGNQDYHSIGTCAYMFYGCTKLKNVNFSSLTAIYGESSSGSGTSPTCYQMFTNSGIESIDLSRVTVMWNVSYMFYNAKSLQNFDLSSAVYASNCNDMFNGCSSLTGAAFTSLSTIDSSAVFFRCFAYCTSLTNLSFPSLTSTSFGSYTNQFNNMLQGVTGCAVHFPSNLQAVIGSWADVTNGFGGTNTTVLFDLPATNTLTGADSVTYTRNPKYDTGTALAWKVGAYGTTDFTPAYYTSGTTDPTVGATIYSDAECTTSVTTISSIA